MEIVTIVLPTVLPRNHKKVKYKQLHYRDFLNNFNSVQKAICIKRIIMPYNASSIIFLLKCKNTYCLSIKTYNC